MLSDYELKQEEKSWIAERILSLTDFYDTIKPSEWAENHRYLPASVTRMPGYYSFSVAPFLREIVDCFSVDSTTREVNVMKGVQIGFTVGVLENIIGYVIEHVKSAPMMFLTADAELAKLRMESYITPMIQQSGLLDCIISSDETNARKTGKTDKKIEWKGGGFLLPFGAQNANKLRSTSIQFLLEDEIDGYPDKVGNDGDPCDLAEDRTAAYEETRKILRGSTPLIQQTSKILKYYLQGTKEKYMVPCKGCGKHQNLVWNGKNEDGTVYGIIWRISEGLLVPGSVKYVCKFCQYEHVNEDKSWWYRENGKYCYWEATKSSDIPGIRSFDLPSFYSPVGMQTWETQVRKWLDAWDVENNRPKDVKALQRFYNNVLGRPFKMSGEGLKLEKVITHRRIEYHQGEIPNHLAVKEAGFEIQLITCAVDVHKNHLDLQAIAWAPGGRFYSVDWLVFEGDTSDITLPTWQGVMDVILNKEYFDTGPEGKKYKIQTTLIDSQYNTDVVLQFCNLLQDHSVFPIRGTESGTKRGNIKEFSEFKTKIGTIGYNINNSIFKDRLASSFRQHWDGQSLQPKWFPNFPLEYPDAFFKELTVEYKVQKKHPVTKQIMGWEWHRPGGSSNHAWDLTVYNLAALEMAAMEICTRFLRLEVLNWDAFWAFCQEKKFFTEK